MWIKKGPVGKAYNFIVWVHRSDVLTQLLRRLQCKQFSQSIDPEVNKQQPLDVILDNDTQWLSQYYMIQRILKLQPIYKEFMLKAKKLFTDIKKGESKVKMPACLEKESFLNKNDWAVLQVFSDILHHFHVVVQVLQGDGQQYDRPTGVSEAFGIMSSVLQAFKFLLGKLKTAKALIKQYPEPEQFRANINLSWIKLNKYYNYLRDSPVYYTAAALYPGIQ